ncbi:MAG: iron-siderophore ABC transporter substrate-binding protein [Cyanobacteria bacterium J06626_18]
MRVRVGIKAIVLFLAALAVALTFSACSSANRPVYEPIPPSEGRTLQHEMGETVVPRTPERVVVLGSIIDALALGVEPVGAAYWSPSRPNREELAPVFSDRTAGITVLGHARQPSLERIVKLQPDLILDEKGGGDFYSYLSQIAPTVVVDFTLVADVWKEDVLRVATALGKPDEAQALIQQYEQRIAQFQEVMGARLDTTVVSVARFGFGQVRSFQTNSFSGAVLAEVGLPRPESQQRKKTFEIISLENLASLDGDVLFFMQNNPEKSILTELQGNTLWSQLGVVQRGQVHEVSLDVWFLNAGIISAHMILNDLFRTLVPDSEQYVIHQVGELPLP